MPKNAVERLQKIEKDLKTAISIYDAANKSNNENENPGKKKKDSDHSQHPTTEGKRRTIFSGVGKYKTTSVESVKKITCLIPRPIEDIQLMKARNKKPNSAPSSSNMSSAGESDSGYRPGRGFALKEEEDSMKDFESASSISTVDSKLYMSPSKVLETANKILSENNFQHDISVNVKHPNKITNNYATINEEKENNKKSSIKNAKEQNANDNSENKKNETVRSNSRYMKQIPTNSKESEGKNRSKVVENKESKKDTSDLSPTYHVIPNKIPRLEKRDKTPGPEGFHSKNFTKTQGEDKKSKEKQNRAWSCDKDLRNNKGNSRGRKSSSEEVKRRPHSNPNKSSTENKEKSESELTDEKFEEGEQYFDAKELFKTVEPNDSSLEAENLSKIIEKSNEKLFRMKVSKNLALDIAKQLKEKYEEVQLSNKELLGRLKKVEKDNEKLVKDMTDSKIKHKLKMEEVRMDSEAMLLQQGMKTREVVDENIRLKTKMKDLEKKHSQEMMDKQKEIDRIQRDIRFGAHNPELQNIYKHKMNGSENQTKGAEGKEKRSQENKNEARRQEALEKDEVFTLIIEKSQLMEKVEQLESLLSAKQSKIEALEGKVQDLEKELEKQNVQLKQKTERLENTNNELESIRQSSKDLEEQVKQLRLSIESFDHVHENLLKQTSDYEKEIKSSQEEIKKLKEEHARMAKELENERDCILIKNKIIDDQQETIRQLRERSEEYKAILRKNQSLERILDVEREEKLEIQEAMERLKRRKEDLKKKIKSLENDLLIAPQEVVRDLQKTQLVLQELENQVQIKQKEWELHLKSLIREKEQACSVAEFATKKLMQTTNEFQKQSEAHKRLHRVLAENLAAKEKRRKDFTEKMTRQVHEIADNTSTTQTDDAKGPNKFLQCCYSVDDGTFCTKGTPVCLPRRTMTSFYVQCPKKT